MIYTRAKCDVCLESQLQLEFSTPDETLLDLLEAVKDMDWKVDTLPGPVYKLRCRNCQNIAHADYTASVAKNKG